MKVENGVLVEVYPEDISSERLVLSDGIEVLSAHAFNHVKNLFRHITLPSTLKEIKEDTFYNCEKLESIVIPEGVNEIKNHMFSNCTGLKKVKFPKSLKSIGKYAFYNCIGLKEIILEDNVETIGVSAFELCASLEKIKLSKNLTVIGSCAFRDCERLKFIFIPKNVSELSFMAFARCTRLEKVIFKYKSKSKLTKIKERAFFECLNLESIDLPNSVELIGDSAFFKCRNLKDVSLPQNLKRLAHSTFQLCENINCVNVPGTINVIDTYCFEGCKNLNRVILSEGLKEIREKAFASTKLTQIYLPQSLEVIEERAFFDTLIQKIVVPYNVKFIGAYAFPYGLKSLSLFHLVDLRVNRFLWCDLNLINKFTNEVIDLTLSWSDASVMSYGDNEIKFSDGFGMSFFDLDNNWVECAWHDYRIINNVKVLSKDIPKIYQWKQTGKFLPNMSVMRNMPLEEINNFYINNNHKKWKELLEIVKLSSDEDISGFFKLCYSLGLFSKSGKTSDRAFNFIKRYIVKTEKKNQYHVRFEEMDIYNKKFNKEFAELVYKYYPKQRKKFLIKKVGFYEGVDCFSAVYNNFDSIRKIHSNKVVNTSTKNKMLTPEICMNYTNKIEYDNVLSGNESFAENISLYGYNQDTFDNAQALFEIGKNIPKEEITLVIAPDKDSALIKYELLEKDNPLGVILGNITNCCQTLNGLANSCVEYGLSKRNSKFMAFRFKGQIVGQSWVWYDEQTHRICLDNIEIVKIENKATKLLVKAALLECLRRVTEGFLKEMADKNLPVNSITLGTGYNEIALGLSLQYKKITNQPKLTGYDGYTDAKNQYVLFKR